MHCIQHKQLIIRYEKIIANDLIYRNVQQNTLVSQLTRDADNEVKQQIEIYK